MKNNRTIKLFLIFILLFSFTGCKEYGEKRIVKLITIDEDNISLFYYDYSSDKPSYLTETSPNTGIENTLVKLLSENDYDLKLCRYAVCSEEIINNNIAELFFALTNSKFSPHLSLITGNTKENSEKYIDLMDGIYPMYSYFADESSIDGIVENPDKHTKTVIVDNNVYKTLSMGEGFVFDAINKKINEGIYIFEDEKKIFSAELESAYVFFYPEKAVLNLKMFAVLKSYKGMASNEKDNERFKELLVNHLERDVKSVFADRYMAENLNLTWFEKMYNFNKINIDITVI